jgi:hypothetical protein
MRDFVPVRKFVGEGFLCILFPFPLGKGLGVRFRVSLRENAIWKNFLANVAKFCM